jgi:hypothetical protein
MRDTSRYSYRFCSELVRLNGLMVRLRTNGRLCSCHPKIALLHDRYHLANSLTVVMMASLQTCKSNAIMPWYARAQLLAKYGAADSDGEKYLRIARSEYM